MNTPILETSRLILRKFTERDMEALFLILKDEEANKFLPWYPVKDLEETRRFYQERYAAKYGQPQAYAYAICLKTDNFPIGYVKVDMEEHHDFGYGLRKEFWHRGIATEAGGAVIAQVRKDGLPYITATHDRNNPRSGNVMRKLGMTYRYSYEELWQPQELPRDIQNVPVKPEWRQRVRVQEILGRGNQSFRRRLVAGHEACCSGGTSHCFLYVYSV